MRVFGGHEWLCWGWGYGNVFGRGLPSFDEGGGERHCAYRFTLTPLTALGLALVVEALERTQRKPMKERG